MREQIGSDKQSFEHAGLNLLQKVLEAEKKEPREALNYSICHSFWGYKNFLF